MIVGDSCSYKLSTYRISEYDQEMLQSRTADPLFRVEETQNINNQIKVRRPLKILE